ncbi:MAG: hypothetical protein P8177_12075, partial [Gemmatimonadota bacterium]
MCERRVEGSTVGWGIRAVGLVALLVATPLSFAAAQEEGVEPAAAPYLAPDHWVMSALRKLDAAGYIDGGFEPAMPGVDRIRAVRLLVGALESGRAEASPLVPRIEGYLDRLTEEFPGALRGGPPPPGPRFGVHRLSTGYVSDDAEPLAGIGTPEWGYSELAAAAPAQKGLSSALDGSAYWGRRFAVRAGVVVELDEVRLGETYGVGVVGPLDLWAGRRPLKLGYGASGVILTGDLPLDGVGLAVHPFRLPWFFEHLGPVTVSTFLGRLGPVSPYDDPWLWL